MSSGSVVAFNYTVWNSQNSKHHVLLKLKTPLSIEMRLFLQTCLGSDVKRELLTYKRILEGETEPSMLFRPRKWGNRWKAGLDAEQVDEISTGVARIAIRAAAENGFIASPPEIPAPNRWR